MTGRRILVHVHNRIRDLPGLALVKHNLEVTYGHDVRLVGSSPALSVAARWPADLVLLFGVWQSKWVYYSKKLAEFGVAVALLPTEPQLTEGPRVAYESGAYSDLGAIGRHFVFNAKAKQLTRQYTGIPDDCIEVVGMPRFDYYRNPILREAFPREAFRARYGFTNEAGLVLWTTSYTWAQFAGPHEIEGWMANLEAQGVFKTPGMREWYRQRIEIDLVVRDRCIAAFRQLTRARPDLMFLIKVHPQEPRDVYDALASQATNVRVTQDDYIQPVILGADVVLHSNCLTAQEAWMAGVETVYLDFEPFLQWPHYCQLSHAVTTSSDLESTVSQIMAGRRAPTEIRGQREAFLRAEFADVDGHGAEQVAEAIDRYVRSAPRLRRRITNNVKLGLLESLGRFRHIRRRLAGDGPQPGAQKAARSSWQLVRHVTEADVRDWTQLIDRAYAKPTIPAQT